ncbi:hypothetical protein CTAM01_03142 [Colletotrichum tamarilloi]|uniref:Secreted protein n=1 Tax=Colletotrichum tamarilloi TaxID=1209934 RepID=A0ABQ9RLM8_9PEZI|nr:uncharacterized protein CTAM01_03142 [Colletotrichum tamarilloi]KAK1506810.1 hypothetical protein CTAM01_03142 [Colletotrichum tamarilloi]
MRGQSPIPKVAFALPHLITPVATAALLVPELLPTGPRQSAAAAVPERLAPNQRHHRRSRTRPARSGLLGSLGHWRTQHVTKQGAQKGRTGLGRRGGPSPTEEK